MGGGAAMRAAAKVAGVGVFNSGFRGIPTVSPAEHPITSAALKATRPIASIFSSSSTNVDVAAPVQKPYLEMRDWEFAGVEEAISDVGGGPMPRVVFGGAPTFDEPKEATSELKTALDEAYLSSNSSGSSFISHPEHDTMVLSNSEHLETKACVTSDTIPTVPKHAIQAFRLLNESSEAQTIVASIACDQNVWNAVMQNPALVEYLSSQKTGTSFSDMDESVKESVGGDEIPSPQSPRCIDDELCKEEYTPRNGFKNFFQNIKVSVVKMMSSSSGFLQSLFGGPEAVDGSSKTNFAGKARGASFMGLAVMVIMVVVLKRR